MTVNDDDDETGIKVANNGLFGKSEIKSHIKRERVSSVGNPLAAGHKMCRGRRQLNLPPLKAVIFHFSKRFQRFGSPRPDVADKTRNHPTSEEPRPVNDRTTLTRFTHKN